jgi:hypothetical protein
MQHSDLPALELAKAKTAIEVDGKQATVRGSYAALDLAVDEMNLGTPIGVPRFVNDWCAWRDLNSRSSEPESENSPSLLFL